MVALRAGDYGTPQAVTAFGLGGGRIRVFRDGFEVVPLAGGSTDLSRVGLGGITLVRLERFPGEVRVYLYSLEFDDGRPYSLVEAGTGDLNTNLLRGTFANPTTLGGDLSLALERADSRGARGDEPGNVQGTWVRYQLHRGNEAGLAVDFRRMGSSTGAEPYAAKVTRTDLTIRGRARIGPDVDRRGLLGPLAARRRGHAGRVRHGGRAAVAARGARRMGARRASSPRRPIAASGVPRCPRTASTCLVGGRPALGGRVRGRPRSSRAGTAPPRRLDAFGRGRGPSWGCRHSVRGNPARTGAGRSRSWT